MEIPLEKDRSRKTVKVETTVYTYSKFRSAFGRWCTFHDHDTEVNIDIQPDESLSKAYEPLSHIDRGIQACPPMSCKEINTYHIKNTTTGISHVEGGWPKDIGYLDQEQTLRYRKKAEREESYIPTMHNLCKLMEECIEQNNSIDIYVRYFSKEPVLDYHPEVSAVVSGNMRDPSGQNRAVSCVSWHPMDSTERVLVSHCDLDFMEVMKTCNDSYIWRIENPFQPECILSGTSPMLTMEYNYKDINLVAGGQHNGQVVFFDTRKSSKMVGLTEKNVSHLEPIHSLMWIQSKTGFECFTTSTDGRVLWWDMRNLNESTDYMNIDQTRSNNLEAAEGGIVLEYSNTVPTKFMVGTEKGNIYSCTRKAKSSAEKLGHVYSEHIGPVYLLQRNPFLYKLFLTVGDYHANIWAEDFAHAPIWKTPLYNTHVLHGGWSPPRPSVFFTTKADGTFDIWDLMNRQKGPEYTLKLTDKRLFCMSTQEKGEFVAVGSETGETYILQLSSEVFEPQSREKNFFTSLVDRESRREKFLFDKEKDRKLNKTILISHMEKELVKDKDELKEILDNTTETFFQTIAEEIKRLQRFKKPEPMEIVEAVKDDCKDLLEEEEDSYDLEHERDVKVMPSDLDLPLYQVESFAVEDQPDTPLDAFQGTIHKKRFKIGHCADIPYPPQQQINFERLKTSDCPALLATMSAPDEDKVEMEPVITKVTSRMVFIREREKSQGEWLEEEEELPSAYSGFRPAVRSMRSKGKICEFSTFQKADSWIEPTKVKQATPERPSVDIQSLGFRESGDGRGELIGGTGTLKLDAEERMGTSREPRFSVMKSTKVDQDLFNSNMVDTEKERSEKLPSAHTGEISGASATPYEPEVASKIEQKPEKDISLVTEMSTKLMTAPEQAKEDVNLNKEVEAGGKRTRPDKPKESKGVTEGSTSEPRKTGEDKVEDKSKLGEVLLEEERSIETAFTHTERVSKELSDYELMHKEEHSQFPSGEENPQYGKYSSMKPTDSIHTHDLIFEAQKAFEEAKTEGGLTIRIEGIQSKTDKVEEDFGKVDKVEEDFGKTDKIEEDLGKTDKVLDFDRTDEIQEDIGKTDKVEEDIGKMDKVEEDIGKTDKVEEDIGKTDKVEEDIGKMDKVEEPVKMEQVDRGDAEKLENEVEEKAE